MANEFVVRNGLISLGGVTVPITGVTGTYTVSENDFTVEALSGSFTITLLNAGLYKGKLYDIKNIMISRLLINRNSLLYGSFMELSLNIINNTYIHNIII